MATWKTHLLLARSSNLPTVWSNVLCAWLLAGGGSLIELFLLSVGGSMLYTGGMYLNDWFDADFDRQHRPERPIPSRQISSKSVLYYSIAWLGCGYAISFAFTPAAILCGTLLLGSIICYDRFHKHNIWSPFTMAACRALLILWVAAATAPQISSSIWLFSISVFFYIVGLSYVARGLKKSILVLLGAFVGIAAPTLIHLEHFWMPSHPLVWLTLLILLVWSIRSLVGLFSQPPRIDFTICGLLAGLVCVDLFVVSVNRPLTPLILISFVAFFAIALLMQKRIPAT